MHQDLSQPQATPLVERLLLTTNTAQTINTLYLNATQGIASSTLTTNKRDSLIYQEGLNSDASQ